MDRRSALALVVAAGCAAPSPGVPLAGGQAPATAPVGLARAHVARAGALGYGSAFVGSRLWASVELGLRFELVLRRLDPGGAVAEIGRVDLGPPDWDHTAPAAPIQGPRVWVGSMDGSVRAVDVGRRRVVATWRAGHAVTAVAVSADGRLVASGSDGGVVCLRRARDAALLQCLVAHGARVAALDFSGERLLSAAVDGSVSVWSVPALAKLRALTVDGSANDIAESSGGAWLAVAVSTEPPARARLAERASIGGSVAVFAAGADTPVSCLGHRSAVTSVAWAGAGGSIASSSWDGSVRLWEIDAGGCRERARRQLESTALVDIANRPGGRGLAVVGMAPRLDSDTVVLLDYLYPRTR